MRITALTALALSLAAASSDVVARSSSQSGAGPTFDVVSIRRNTAGANSGFTERPDGGFTVTNTLVAGLVRLAYPLQVAAGIVGLPDWATSERFDVTATSSLSQVTPADRMA